MRQAQQPQPDLPSGMITFLFTDIEGSTKLWEEHPDVMRTSLARHDALMRHAIASANGEIFKTIGDAFCAVFATAPEALEATLACQLALLNELWPPETPLKVRMALLTGTVESRDNDYFGPPVNRVARLLATAHGGQSILSEVTTELCQGSLPVGCDLKPLGEHRLKDLGRPENVFQLVHPDLPDDFPPLRSLTHPQLKHNLPQQVTSFVGREKELADVRGLMKKSRLLTLIGPGGTGKTRLALQVAAELLDDSQEGVWLVELAPLSDPGLVSSTVASVLGVKEEPGKPLLQTLVESLRNKHLVLVLDNSEHLLDACAKLADTLLKQCPHVLIMATSREGLSIAGETTFAVPSLSLPDPRVHQTPESLSRYEAVRLFLDRAHQVQPAFALTHQNAQALASICHQLDGIPLAMELAAARVRSLSVEDINNKLDQRFRLLTGGSRAALPRQQTLRSLIDWSYDLLSNAEQALLCRLSVFAGGWILETAEGVAPGDPIAEWEVLDLLTALCDKSLVVSEPRAGSTRYRLQETVRQYARDRLEEGGDRSRWRDRHLAHFLALAEEAEPQLMGSDQTAWLERLETEHDNLRAALEWSSDDTCLRLVAALFRFWSVRGHFSEGRERLTRALARDPGGAPAVRARALNGAGVLAWRQGGYTAARAIYEQSLALFRELNDPSGIAYSLNNLGLVASEQGHYPEARAAFEESLVMKRELGDRLGIAYTLNNLGLVSCDLGDYAAARALFEESLAIKRELGDTNSIATELINLGIVAYNQGDYTAAGALNQESLTLCQERGDRWGIAWSLEGMAALFTVQGAPLRAARLWGAAEQLREELGARLPPADRARYEQQVATAREALADDAAFDAAWAEGRVMTMDQATELAR